MKKVMVFSALIMAPLVIGLAVYIFGAVANGEKWAAFSKIQDSNPPLTQVAVENLMGQPVSIEHSQSPDQTITGEVYHYPYHGDDMKVVFINGTVFKAEFVSGAKS